MIIVAMKLAPQVNKRRNIKFCNLKLLSISENAIYETEAINGIWMSVVGSLFHILLTVSI